MADSFDQFHRRVKVRLPIADRYLGNEREAAAATRDIAASFRHLLLRMPIPARTAPKGNRAPATGTTGGDTEAYTDGEGKTSPSRERANAEEELG